MCQCPHLTMLPICVPEVAELDLLAQSKKPDKGAPAAYEWTNKAVPRRIPAEYRRSAHRKVH
jgi:hypothetical protein